MAECTCFELPPEMWTTHYGAVEPGSTHEPNPNCREHFRKPPTRLADGTWSDGVDRSQPLVMSGFGSANEDRMTVFWMRHGSKFGVAAGNPETFPEFESFAEAIAYADRMARTNQGENND